MGTIEHPLDKPTDRAPLLSDDDMIHMAIDGKPESGQLLTLGETCGAVRNFYEAKITSGELMVVKKAKLIEWPDEDEWWQTPLVCSLCDAKWMSPADDDGKWKANFCPGCGSKIVK